MPAPNQLPDENTIWVARDGRRMRLMHWISNRDTPTAMMEVLNAGPRMHRFTQQRVDGFGSFLTLEEVEE